MKKSLAIIALAVLASMPAMAQFSYGIRGGVNLVNNDIKAINRESAMDKDSYTGFFFGPMAEISLFGVGIDAAVLYSQKGMELADEETMKQQMLSVPLYLKYSFGLGKLLGVFAQAGAQFDYNLGDLSTTLKSTMEGTTDRYTVKEYVLKQNVWSANLGAGVKLFGHLQAAVNYNIPLTKDGVYNLYDNLDQTQSDNLVEKVSDYQAIKEEFSEGKSKLKSSTLQLSVTYVF